MQLTLDITPKL